MAVLNGLPVYNILISEDLENKTGLDFISLVDYPAIEKNWIAMGDHKKPMIFSVDEDKQMLYGPILIPDMPIYRYDKEIGEYYVVFSASEIEKLVRKFQAQQKTINLNYQHQKDSQIKEAVIQEIWLTGTKDKSQDMGFDLPEKSAFIGTYIGNKKFWTDEVKTGNVRGFSIEGFLDMEMSKLKKHNMSSQKFAAYKTADGNGDVYIDGEIAADNYVFSNYPSVTLVNGVKQVTQYPVWQDTIVLEDGTILNLKDSKILTIEKKTGMSKKTKLSAEAKTSDGKTLKTTADLFAEGSDILMVDEAGTETPCPDGDYTLENGDVISVAGGIITAINELELTAEEDNIISVAALKAVQPLLTAMQATIEELKTKLSNIPGKSPDQNKIPETGQLSSKQTLALKLEILRKKSLEGTDKKQTSEK